MSDTVTNNNLPLQNIRDKQRHGMNNEVASWDQIFDVRVSGVNRSASSQTLNSSLLQPTVQPRNNQLPMTMRRSPRRSMSQEILTNILDDSTRVSMPEPFVDVLDPRPKDTVDEHVRSRSGSEGLIGSLQKYVSWRLSVGIGSKGGNLPGTHHWYRYRLSRFSSRRVRKRVVFKHGDCNIVQGNVAKRRTRYLQDIFTTLVDAQWRWTLLVFVLNFLLSWLCFACVWYLIVTTHGDLRPENLNKNGTTAEWKPCVTNIDSFTSCFLFSVETQHTIGYGGRMTTEECPEAIAVMCLQSIAGVFIQAFMVGIVFAKLSRPKKRTQTLLFSRNAVICQRDGQPCLMFRVGDMRHKSHIIEAHVRAQLIQRKMTREGEELPFYQQELKVGNDGEEDRLFFIWPTTIVHKIDRDSPLYKFSARDLLREHFEIVVLLEGVVESTGMTTQARSSYLPSEILWGHRFQPIISFKKETSEYEVDYTLFNNTVEVETPLCSSKQLDAQRAALRNNSVDQSTSETYQIRPPSTETLTTLSSADSLQLLNNYEENSPCSTRNRQTVSPLPKCTIAIPEDDDSVS